LRSFALRDRLAQLLAFHVVFQLMEEKPPEKKTGWRGGAHQPDDEVESRERN
jgi:hypothetical protein